MPTRLYRNVGEQKIGSFGVLVECVTENHVGQLVQDELLPMKRGVGVRVQNEV